MQDECVICKAPLKYLEQDILMECEVCHKKENSKTMCVNGHYVCIVTKASPLAKEAWGLANRMTSKALECIGENGGPRCCKRDSYLAILAAVEFTKEHLGVTMEVEDIKCSRSVNNNQCIQGRCPFYKPKVAFICVHNSCRSQMAEA